jgi:GGDEF domain-containing protein
VESWIGIASYPLHGEHMKHVLDLAEQALQTAATEGSAPVVVYGYSSRTDTLVSLEKDWESLLQIAKDNQQSVSVLSVTISQPLRPEMAELIQRELRSRDVIAAVPNGFYVFLFKADEHVVARVAARIEEALDEWDGVQSWVGTGSYPGDGEMIGELLRHAERNAQRMAFGENITY